MSTPLHFRTCTGSCIPFGALAIMSLWNYLSRSEERRVGKECRSRCDWSSDVCSSDLIGLTVDVYAAAFPDMHRELYSVRSFGDHVLVELSLKIGRASCRERV